MTQSEYEQFCRMRNSEKAYYTEDEIASKCEYLCRKYNTPYKAHRAGWFEGQLKVAEMIGIYWMDMYNKSVDIETLFKAYSIENGTL